MQLVSGLHRVVSAVAAKRSRSSALVCATRFVVVALFKARDDAVAAFAVAHAVVIAAPVVFDGARWRAAVSGPVVAVVALFVAGTHLVAAHCSAHVTAIVVAHKPIGDMLAIEHAPNAVVLAIIAHFVPKDQPVTAHLGARRR